MKKIIGISADHEGDIREYKLFKELKKAKLPFESFEMDPDTGELYLTFDDAIEEQINTILAAHDPTPDPEPLTLEEQVAVLDGAMNELLFEILPSLQGGEI